MMNFDSSSPNVSRSAMNLDENSAAKGARFCALSLLFCTILTLFHSVLYNCDTVLLCFVQFWPHFYSVFELTMMEFTLFLS